MNMNISQLSTNTLTNWYKWWHKLIIVVQDPALVKKGHTLRIIDNYYSTSAHWIWDDR